MMTSKKQIANGFTEMMRGFWGNQDLKVPDPSKITATEEKLNKWISVSDPLNELPKDKRLLVTVLDDYDYRYVTELYYDMTEWNNIYYARNAIAYQYYPEPYKEVEDDRKRT